MNTLTGVNFLFVLPSAVLGGAERVAQNLALYLLSEGASVTIYVMSKGRQEGWGEFDRFDKCSLNFSESSSEKGSIIGTALFLWRISRSVPLDYVFSTHAHVNGFLSFLRKAAILKCGHLVSRESTVVFERFFGLKRFLFYFIYRFFYGAQDLVICQTMRMRQSLLDTLGRFPVHRVEVIENPVNLHHVNGMLSAVHEDGSGFERFGARKVIVACGRLIPLKGFEVLLRSFAGVSERYDSILYVIGSGEQKGYLECLVASLGIDNRVVFTGRLENPFLLFGLADIGVVSSYKEGFPNVVLEMMASGTKYVISTPCADGLAKIPGLEVLSGFDEQEMSRSLCRAIEAGFDRSVAYKSYIFDERDVSKYWVQILTALA